MSMKNPLTPSGIEPATFRFVAQQVAGCTVPNPQKWWPATAVSLPRTQRYSCTLLFPERIKSNQVLIRYSFFCDVTQRRLIAVLRFGTKYRSHLQGWNSPRNYLDCLTLEDGTDRVPQNNGNYLPIYAALTSRKSDGLRYTAAVAWYH